MSEGSLYDERIREADAPFVRWDDEEKLLLVQRGPIPLNMRKECEERGQYRVLYVAPRDNTQRRVFWGIEFTELDIVLAGHKGILEHMAKKPNMPVLDFLHYLIKNNRYQIDTRKHTDWELTLSDLDEELKETFVPIKDIHYFVTGSRRHLS